MTALSPLAVSRHREDALLADDGLDRDRTGPTGTLIRVRQRDDGRSTNSRLRRGIDTVSATSTAAFHARTPACGTVFPSPLWSMTAILLPSQNGSAYRRRPRSAARPSSATRQTDTCGQAGTGAARPAGGCRSARLHHFEPGSHPNGFRSVYHPSTHPHVASLRANFHVRRRRRVGHRSPPKRSIRRFGSIPPLFCPRSRPGWWASSASCPTSW